MSDRTRDDSGRFSEKVSDQDFLKLFDKTDDAFLTAPEIAEEFGVTRQAVSKRLRRMEKEGLVKSKSAGANAVGWWSLVAPRLSPTAEKQADAASQEDAVSLEDLESESDSDA
ncbi:winged helix-turn-helix domain-containing protein [Halobium salinum]|uniref:Winged helix-turn-helix domain-containing protein n=1 Tax=Halobium salinum TaxID=1364940 RepID=A0ABD5PI24_9EURY|nr:winged helix-turn-helix domain-containing protein [Halobium salinum]